MPDRIPKGITREHILRGIADFEARKPHEFSESTGYDLFYDGKRYPPKAIIGLAAAAILGEPLRPEDFRGGLDTLCFRILEAQGFSIVAKGDTALYPDDLDSA